VMLKEKGATPEEIATHPHPFYTPIATFGTEYAMEPVAYGLKFAGALSGGAFLKGDFSAQIQSAGVDGTAYAARLAGGAISVVVLNKDAGNNLDLTMDFGAGKTGSVQMETLHAPGLESREAHITAASESPKLKGGRITVTVPRATGLRITVG
jgi:hypothetical protein